MSEVTDQEETARRLRQHPMRCLVVDCEGHINTMSKPRFHMVCDLDSTHVWRKEDLYYLRPQLVKV